MYGPPSILCDVGDVASYLRSASRCGAAKEDCFTEGHATEVTGKENEPH